MRRNAKRKKLIRVFTTTTAVVAISLGALIFFAKNKNTSSVVAIINGQKISKSEVDQKLRMIFEGQNFSNQAEYKPIEVEALPKEVVEILVKEIYLEKELTKEAQKSKVAKLEETKNKIAESTARILRQSYIDSVIKTEVTDQKISDKYAELTNEIVGKKEYAISHIVLKTKEEAEKIAKEFKAKKPAKFSDLARKYSVDQESGQRGGDLGYILEDNIVKEISTEIAKLKKDQISQPIETKFGWHLIKFTDIREAKALPFEEVKENIREQLYQDALNGINSKITKDLKIQVLISAKEQPKVDAIEESKEEKEEITAAPTTETEEKSKEEASDKTEDAKAAGEKSQINADEKSKKPSKK
jgi:parvulin-like peptidyl-prolyl isomerase